MSSTKSVIRYGFIEARERPGRKDRRGGGSAQTIRDPRTYPQPLTRATDAEGFLGPCGVGFRTTSTSICGWLVSAGVGLTVTGVVARTCVSLDSHKHPSVTTIRKLW